MSLAATTPSNGKAVAASGARIEQVISPHSRILLIGEAGSGKTTLLQWLAVRSAIRDFPAPLDNWKGTTPFLIQLPALLTHNGAMSLSCLQGMLVPALESSCSRDLSRSREPDSHEMIALLAFNCLKYVRHVPPTLRRDVEDVARAFVPPRSMDAAVALASVGEFVVDLISDELPLQPDVVKTSVRTLSLIGDDHALQVIGKLIATQESVGGELLTAWPYFDPHLYAQTVLPRLSASAHVRSPTRNYSHTYTSYVRFPASVLTPPNIIPLQFLGQRLQHLLTFPSRALHGRIKG
jgi:hypothetical protein